MTTYTVYSPSRAIDSASERHDETVLIPEATSVMALAFPFFWLLWYRLWWACLFYVLLTVVVLILLPGDLKVIVAALTIFPGLFLFLEGHELRRKRLERRGWKKIATVEDQDLDSAEYRYFYSVLENRKSVHSDDTKPFRRQQSKPFTPIDTGIEFPGTVGL